MRPANLVQFIPSAAWVALYFGPLLLLRPYFPEHSAALQAGGAAVILVALLLGDGIAARFDHSPFDTRWLVPNWMLPVCAVLTVLIPALNYAIAGQLPFLVSLQGASSHEVALLRQSYTKDLPVPQVVQYLFQYVTTVFGPLVTGLLFLRGRLFWAAVSVLWVAFYGLSSGAKAPALVFLFTLLLLLIRLYIPRLSLIAPLTILVLGVALFLAGTAKTDYLLTQANQSPLKDQVQQLRERTGEVTPGDIERLVQANESEPLFNRHLDPVLYRLYLTPVEVSNRWYSYFPSRYGSYLGFEGLTEPTRDGRHPSNIVGRDVYQERFPDRYLDSVHAYSSIDADAFAHFGYWGWLFAAANLVFIRVLSVFVRSAEGVVLQTAQLSLLALLPFQASIQSIYVAQGVGLLLVFQILLALKANRMPKRTQPQMP